MASNLGSADWLEEIDESISEEDDRSREQLFMKIADLSHLSMFPPFNYEYGQNADLLEVRKKFVEAVISANTALIGAKSFPATFLDKFTKDISTDIAEAEMYKSRYKTTQKATEAYIKDNKGKNLSIDDFSV